MKNFIFIKLFFVLIYSISSVGFSETWNDFILKNGQYYKKTSDLPFTGEITEKVKVRVGGSFKNGYREGSWVWYWDNGHLQSKGNYKKENKMVSGLHISIMETYGLQRVLTVVRDMDFILNFIETNN